jgi:hypothetical protein
VLLHGLACPCKEALADTGKCITGIELLSLHINPQERGSCERHATATGDGP